MKKMIYTYYTQSVDKFKGEKNEKSRNDKNKIRKNAR